MIPLKFFNNTGSQYVLRRNSVDRAVATRRRDTRSEINCGLPDQCTRDWTSCSCVIFRYFQCFEWSQIDLLSPDICPLLVQLRPDFMSNLTRLFKPARETRIPANQAHSLKYLMGFSTDSICAKIQNSAVMPGKMQLGLLISPVSPTR